MGTAAEIETGHSEVVGKGCKDKSANSSYVRGRSGERKTKILKTSIMHVYITCYSTPPTRRTDGRRETFKAQNDPIVLCETIARDG